MVWIFWMSTLLLSPAAFADLRDPTRPENVQEVFNVNQLHSYELQAIISSQDERMAIFNNQTVRVGDQMGAFQVTEITANTVHLDSPDGKMTLFLFNQNIKKLTDRR